MDRIAIITPGLLPVPAIKGGAIETLVQILVEQNEKYKKAKLIVFTSYNLEAKNVSEKYQYTQFVYVKYNYIINYIWEKAFRGLKKLTGFNIKYPNLYYWKTYCKLKTFEFDKIIAEGGDYRFFSVIKRLVDEEHIYMHIHHHMLPNVQINNIFKNVISVSQFVQNEWINNVHNIISKKTVVYNCIHEEIFLKTISEKERVRLREKLGFLEDDFIVLFCGRIIEVKGVKELLESFQNIENKKIKLLIIGSSNFGMKSRTYYERQIKKLVDELGNRVKFTGYIENKELFKYYQICNMQIVPSLWEEAAGLVCIEGMYSGLPLVVTNSGGMIEYVDNDCAIIIDKGEGIQLRIKLSIEYLYENPQVCNKMSYASKKRALIFTKKKFYKEFIDSISINNS